jgi:glycogen debranching enzyme
MTSAQVNILDGNTFVVSDRSGDIEAGPTDTTGLFSYDTRFLSQWVLTIDGQRLNPLSVDDLQYFETRFFLAPGTGSVYVNATLSVVRERAVGNGFREKLILLNDAGGPVDLVVRLDAGADFADLFEVKDAVAKKGKYYHQIARDHLLLGYERGNFHRETEINTSQPASFDEHGLTLRVHIDAHSQWSTDINVVTSVLSWTAQTPTKKGRPQANHRNLTENLQHWLDDAPRLETDRDSLKQTYRRSLIDLAALRFSPPIAGGMSLPAAGLPWFMAMFGRDAIITSLQALPFTQELASTTLLALGGWQGVNVDDFREEEPGRILHEMRYGETAAFEEQPHTPYYGNADATMLYVVLLDEYERWTGDSALARRLEPVARAALRWIDEYADRQGNGYVSYKRANEETGLENQCWKDSWDSISYRDGRLPGFPRATCELQGYAYDAKRRGARLARDVWNDPKYAESLEQEAADLKRRFNRDFWIQDGGYFAVALDADGSQVDSLASNMGHLLWSGILDQNKARSVVRHLMGPAFFSGWGVRSLAEGQGRSNPIGYHNGAVWPFDNSIIAWGLRRYGYKAEAARIASAILDAAEFFEGRLPEAFAGHDRSFTRYPVEYPTACSPQAWSTGTPLLLLRTMLGLDVRERALVTDPAVPQEIGYLALLDIAGAWGRVDAFGHGRSLTSRRATPRAK